MPGAVASAEVALNAAESHLRFHAGNALTRLGDTAAARPILDRALDLCGPYDCTDWAMIRLDALTPAQRSAHAAREFRGLLDDTVGMKEVPA